jgi:Gas vesicle protein K/Gas vesicle protein
MQVAAGPLVGPRHHDESVTASRPWRRVRQDFVSIPCNAGTPSKTVLTVSLVDLLDRLLDTGATVSGDVVLSIAGVDLVWVGLRAIVASVETARPDRPGHEPNDAPNSRVDGEQADHKHLLVGCEPRGSQGPAGDYPRGSGARSEPPDISTSVGRPQDPRLDFDEDDTSRGLVQLVLTVVELLRQLMERQAIKRMEAGSLSEAEVDRLGLTLARLAERMEELKHTFELADDDVELRLGPISELV